MRSAWRAARPRVSRRERGRVASQAVRVCAAAVLWATSVALVAGCGSPSATPTATARRASANRVPTSGPPSLAAVTAEASPTPTSPTSSTAVTSDLAVRFPKTQQGAEDFVRFVMAQVSKAYATGDPSVIRPLVDVTTCPDCSRWISATVEMKQNSRHYEGVFVTMQSVHSLTVQGDSAGVITQVVAPAGKTVDSQGRTVHARSAEGPFRTDFFLQFREHWFVTNTEIVR